MRVALVTRASIAHWKRGGGIVRSGRMYQEAASTTKDLQIDIHSEDGPINLPSDTDLAWLYGDWANAEKCINAARKLGIPSLAVSNFNQKTGRSKAIGDMHQKVDSGQGDVYLQTFTYAAERMVPNGHMVPQPFQYHTGECKAFEDRRGVCFGEVCKLLRRDLTRDWPIQDIVSRLTDRGIPCWTYRQYGLKQDVPSGLSVREYDPARGFVDWLGTFRAFALVTIHETFAMVPLESMQMGTPVCYRPMPQSHDEYIGPSGIRIRTPDDLVSALIHLHENEDMWTRYSDMARERAKLFSLDVLGQQVQTALEQLLRRHHAKSLG